MTPIEKLKVLYKHYLELSETEIDEYLKSVYLIKANTVQECIKNLEN